LLLKKHIVIIIVIIIMLQNIISQSFLFIKKMLKKNISTNVFNIDNNNECFLSIKLY